MITEWLTLPGMDSVGRNWQVDDDDDDEKEEEEEENCDYSENLLDSPCQGWTQVGGIARAKPRSQRGPRVDRSDKQQEWQVTSEVR